MESKLEAKEVYETKFEIYYGELTKPSKRYLRKLKKKMLRSNRDRAYLYKALETEARAYFKQEEKGEKVEYPIIKVRKEELLQDLPKINYKKELQDQLTIILWIMTAILVLKSGYHLFTNTSYTILLSDIMGLILVFLNGLSAIGGSKILRITIFISLIVLVVGRDAAQEIHLATISSSTGFIIAAVFLVITPYFRKK